MKSYHGGTFHKLDFRQSNEKHRAQDMSIYTYLNHLP